MIKKNITVLLSIFLIVTSCKTVDQEGLVYDKKVEIIKTIPLDESDYKPIKIDSKNIEYIPLETTAAATIGRIDKIQVFDGNYIITDKKNAKAIFIFDGKGHFLNKISPFGKGPQEITSMDAVAYNKATKQIEIYDSFKKQISIYSLNGDFVREFKTKIYLRSFHPIKKNERYYYAALRSVKEDLNMEKNYRLLRMDENANLLNSYFDTNDNQLNEEIIELKNNFYPIANSDKVFFLEAFSNKIFELKGDSLILKYKMDFDGANPPDDLYDMDNISKITGIKAVNKFAVLNDILFDDDNELVIQYEKNDLYRQLHYDRINKEYFEFKNRFVLDDNVYVSIDHYISKDFSISKIEPMYLLKKNINTYSKRVQKMLAGKKSTDNPIIVKIKR
jgi:hypothetical protein